MEHLRDEFDAGGFVGVLLFEVHDEAEGAVFKGRVGRTDDDGVPVANHKRFSDFVRGFFFLSEDGGAAGLLQGGGGNGYQVITLSAMGEAETPAGGSVCIRWESMSVRAWQSNGAARATVNG